MSNGERQVLVGVCAVVVKVMGASGNRARSLLVAADIDGDNILELEVPFQLWEDKRGHEACRKME